MRRRPVNKRRSAGKFRRSSHRMKAANTWSGMRGGIRL